MKRLFLASEAVMILLLAFFKNSVTVCKESQRYLKQKSYLSCGNRSFNRKLQCQDLLEYYKPANHPHLPKKYNVSVEAPAAKMQLLKETHVKDDLYVNTKPQHQTMPSWSASNSVGMSKDLPVMQESEKKRKSQDVQKDPENVFVPEEFSAENESVTVWDHIDNLEDTRSGAVKEVSVVDFCLLFESSKANRSELDRVLYLCQRQHACPQKHCGVLSKYRCTDNRDVNCF
eukprot:gene1129-485_t